MAEDNSSEKVAVGMPITRHPPHRSVREELPHTAPASGYDAKPLESRQYVFCQVRSMLHPISEYSSQSSYPEFPLANGLSSSVSAIGCPIFVRCLHRYYAAVRLLNSVHVRIIRHRPSLTDPPK